MLTESPLASAEEVSLLDENGDLLRQPPVPGLDIQSDHVSKILFLNRCANGCTITSGNNDARYNTSSIVAGTSLVSPWRHGDSSWSELVQCVKEIYAPYDVQVTDVDPGDNVFHHEAIVAGRYTDIGYETPIGGVAPSGCTPINNVISFTFANGYPNSPTAICHTVGQESAHSYGLEHAYDCSDPMTYLPTCGRQFFRDATTPCGEFEPLSQCRCGGTAQNSHRWLRTVLGENPMVVAGPTIAIQSPAEGEAVTAGFSIGATAAHMRGIGRVQMWINGTMYGEEESNGSPSSPYWFQTPAGLSDGIIDIEIRATNDIGTESVAAVTVQKGAPCTSADSCEAGQLCEEGRCKFPTAVGELGDACVSDMECLSELCPKQGETGYCSQNCFPTATENTCPDGFSCLEVNASRGVCWPKEDTGNCGCQSSSSAGQLGGLLLICLVLLGLRRQRISRDYR